jgi:hypothetical protein
MSKFIPRRCVPALESRALASVTATIGEALIVNGAGYLTNSGVATAVDIVGVAAETVNGTGGAGTKNLLYYPAFDEVLFEVDWATTTPAQTDEGETIDIVSATTVNVGASDYQQFRVYDYDYSSTTVLGSFVDSAYGAKPS